MQDALHMPEEVVKQKCALMVQIIMFLVIIRDIWLKFIYD